MPVTSGRTYTTQGYSVKLTGWCFQWIEGADKEGNGLLLVKHTHIHNTRLFSKTHHLILAMERADKKRNGLYLVTTWLLRKTYHLMLAIK